MKNEAAQTITALDGITYTVLARQTVDELKATAPATADMMASQNKTAMMIVQRPKGRRQFLAYEFTRTSCVGLLTGVEIVCGL